MYEKLIKILIISSFSLAAYSQEVTELELYLEFQKAQSNDLATDKKVKLTNGFEAISTENGKIECNIDILNRPISEADWGIYPLYVGEMKNGIPHGKGEYIFKRGNKYVGEFEQGKFNGRGTLVNEYGETFYGGFKDGAKNGFGMLHCFDGMLKESGTYENNKLIDNRISKEEIHQKTRESNLDWLRLRIEFCVRDQEKWPSCERYKTLFPKIQSIQSYDAAAAANLGKTGPIGLGSIKLGMRAISIRNLPNSAEPKILEWTDIQTRPNNLGRIIIVKINNWLSNIEEYPEKIEIKVFMTSPIAGNTYGKLIFENGKLAEIEIDLLTFARPDKFTNYKPIGGITAENIHIAAREEIKAILTEKYGAGRVFKEKKNQVCYGTLWQVETTNTLYEWRESNKLLGTVITRLKSTESCDYANRSIKKEVLLTISNQKVEPKEYPKNIF